VKRVKVVILYIIVCGIFLHAENKRRFMIDDYFKTQDISDIRISPDGEKVVFVKQEVIDDKSAEGKMKRKHDIYMVTLADNEIHRLTSHEIDSSMPRWSPDGRYLFFLSTRCGKSQIWMLDMKRGGEGQQLTDWDPGIEDYACSPDSEYIAFVSKDPKNKNDADDDEKGKRNDPYVITRTLYLSDGIGYFGDPREWRHLWVISLADPKNPRKITDGDFDDRNCEWSPDGRHIAFVSNRTGDDDNNDNTDIWIVSSGGGKPQQITSNPGADDSPLWSPDGRFIAYISNPQPNNLYKINHLCVVSPEGGRPVCLSKSMDREVQNLAWDKDSKAVYGLVPDKARVHVYKFTLEDKKIKRIISGERRLDQLCISKDNRFFAFTLEDNDHPAELFTASSDGQNLMQRTYLNQGLRDDLLLGRTEKIVFENPDGQEVEGFVLFPPDFDAQKKYPLILKIHGGPKDTDGNYYSAEGQWYAANGYIVLWVNYRGSSDYGEAWQEAIAVNWYFKEYDDLMAAVDFMCEKDFVDSQRLGVTGVSYGGCMTTWIVGHTDRFAAAVAERFTSDNFSAFGVDDTPYWYEKDLGLPYDEKNFAQYRKTSAIHYVKNCTTPILIMQCMEDHRCPLPQALQYYMGLKKLKKAETQLILYPREPHGIKEIPHQSDRLQRIVSWFDYYLKK
jgi:dipeptidyl aminopeptidase/acylaminoacyl peptidase